MAQQVTVLDSGVGRIVVLSPYHPEFPARAKKLGGKWDAGQGAWTFDRRDLDRVRALCVLIYGTDGTPLPRGGLVTIRTDPSKCDAGKEGKNGALEYWLCGRLVAKAFSRDGGARLGDGVVTVSGGFGSGGSVKNPAITFRPGTIFELRDVPRAIAEKLHAEYHGVTLLDADGVVIAEPTVATEPVAAAGVDPTAELEREIAEAEGRLAGLRFRLAETRA